MDFTEGERFMRHRPLPLVQPVDRENSCAGDLPGAAEYGDSIGFIGWALLLVRNERENRIRAFGCNS